MGKFFLSGASVFSVSPTHAGVAAFTLATVFASFAHAAGPASSNCRWLTVSGDRLYLSAEHPSVGRELWAAPLSAFELSDSVKPSHWQRYK